jgi:SAM-dependent methyltransferase
MYHWMYRLGITPWERYRVTASDIVTTMLDMEQTQRLQPPGRALDLGCGRGVYTTELARRGWDTVGIDNVPVAIEAARRAGGDGITFVVGDVTRPPDDLGTFDLFLDIGCIGGLDAHRRRAAGRAVTKLANVEATVLLMAFGSNPWPWVRGVSPDDVQAAFPRWEMLTVVAADTTGLGWPMNRTNPHWYRLRLPALAVV